MPKSTNITLAPHPVKRSDREANNAHRGAVLWFTGLSGAGKSTLAFGMEDRLFKRGCQVYVLDGDNLRHGLNQDLGFSQDDRAENIRRAGELAALFSEAGIIVISAFISPYALNRRQARKAANGHFHEIYIKANLDVCESRDAKGLYKKARKGEITNFTGIGLPYEQPENPELIVDTANNNIASCLAQIEDYVNQHLIF